MQAIWRIPSSNVTNKLDMKSVSRVNWTQHVYMVSPAFQCASFHAQHEQMANFSTKKNPTVAMEDWIKGESNFLQMTGLQKRWRFGGISSLASSSTPSSKVLRVRMDLFQWIRVLLHFFNILYRYNYNGLSLENIQKRRINVWDAKLKSA